MHDNLWLILIAVVLCLAGIAVATYYIIRFLRGSIKITLPSTRFTPGDSITGSFTIVTKKMIQGNKLAVCLIGEEVTKYRQGKNTRTDTREIHRDEVLVEKGREYPAGYSAMHEFSFITPDKTISGFGDSQIAQSISTVATLLSGRRTYLRWKIEARLDAKGVDLASSKRVKIN